MSIFVTTQSSHTLSQYTDKGLSLHNTLHVGFVYIVKHVPMLLGHRRRCGPVCPAAGEAGTRGRVLPAGSLKRSPAGRSLAARRCPRRGNRPGPKPPAAGGAAPGSSLAGSQAFPPSPPWARPLLQSAGKRRFSQRGHRFFSNIQLKRLQLFSNRWPAKFDPT